VHDRDQLDVDDDYHHDDLIADDQLEHHDDVELIGPLLVLQFVDYDHDDVNLNLNLTFTLGDDVHDEHHAGAELVVT
jgi:hypothetical protein